MTPNPDISVLLPDEAVLRARRGALVESVRAPRRGARRRPARRLLLAVLALVVLGGGAAVAAHLLSADDIAVEAGIGCYDGAALDADVTVTSAAADPLSACAALWRRGEVGADAHVPQLVACTGEGEPVRVFPGVGPAVCRSLGLEPLPTDYAPAGAAAQRATAALATLRTLPTATSECPYPATLVAAARRRLAAAHRGVDVTIHGAGPCAGGLDVEDGAVVVTTVGRGVAHHRWLGARIEAALRPLFAANASGCRNPHEVAVQARHALASAGVAGVTVAVDGDGACLAPGLTIDAAQGAVVLAAQDAGARGGAGSAGPGN